MIILVSIVNQNENAEKLEVILDAAQKRFGQFGLTKTTMSEIALEAGMSKASLYYYYPDKQALFKAVIEREHQHFISAISELIDKEADPKAILLQYNSLRINLSKKMITLAKMESSSTIDAAKPLVLEIFKTLLGEEEKVVARVIETAISNGIFQRVDAQQMAALYVNSYRGLRMTMREKYSGYPTEEDEAEMEKQLSLFTEVFVKGLKK